MAYGFNEDKEKVPVYSQNDIGQLVQQIMLSVYPVGAIYMSVSATDQSMHQTPTSTSSRRQAALRL